MKIDSAIKEFLEKYDTEAIRSIDELAQDLSLTRQKAKMPAFNLQEGIDTFIEFLEGYANYKIENINNEKASPHEAIVEHTKLFISGKLFKETTETGEDEEILIESIPKFVESYIKGIPNVISTIDKLKAAMLESGTDLESIAVINDFADDFMESLHERFDPVMDKILWASGYNSKIALRNAVPKPKETPVFL